MVGNSHSWLWKAYVILACLLPGLELSSQRKKRDISASLYRGVSQVLSECGWSTDTWMHQILHYFFLYVFLEGSFPSLISVSLLIKRGNNKPISGGRVLNNIWNGKSVDTHKRKSLLFPILVFSVSFRCEGECQVHKTLAFLKSVASESGACGEWMSGHHSE